MVEGNYHLYFNKPLVSFNSMHVCDEFDHVPQEAEAITVHLDQCVALIDHTSCEHLLSTVEELARSGFPARVDGLDALQPMSDYHASVRVVRASETLVPAM
jgi:carbonic anhydrase